MKGFPSEAELTCLRNIKTFEDILHHWIDCEEINDGLDKYARYKKKLIAKGCCPHCGKPCAPYFECEERRAYKREYYRKLRQSRGSKPYKPSSHWDRRTEPKQGHNIL